MKNENMIISPCVYIYKKTENNLRIEKLFFFFFKFQINCCNTIYRFQPRPKVVYVPVFSAQEGKEIYGEKKDGSLSPWKQELVDITYYSPNSKLKLICLS